MLRCTEQVQMTVSPLMFNDDLLTGLENVASTEYGGTGKLKFFFLASLCLSVRPSVRMEQLGSHGTNLHGI